MKRKQNISNTTPFHGVWHAGAVIVNGFKKLFSNPNTAIGIIIMALYLLVAIIGPTVFPYDQVPNVTNKYLPSSLEHPFGTDWLGRDVFRQVVAGTRSILEIAFYSAVFTVFAGTVLGILSGFMGGVVDQVITAVTNVFLCIPSFPVYLLLASLIVIETPIAMALVVFLWSWPGLCRAIRVQVLSLKERDFIQICQVMHMSKAHIIFKELMPNILSYIVINFVIAMRNAITASVGIMMIGLASYDPTNWGAIINAARGRGLINPANIQIMMYPLCAIVIFQVAAIMLANGLDETLNPRLKVL